ncbi:FAD-dependent monooxygenase [Kribbella sp. NBC_01505]|uniref:FAD-dependent oxidoreductase n=1 Tax=Kribbella sp. NBC_01505 TaxID=2903580 RepID=UPI00386DBCD3
MRVVVVGAGLGGLCVANALHAAGWDVEVLEAQNKIRDERQGYRININPSGHDALRTCLNDEQFAAYERLLHRQPDAAVYLYSSTLDLLARYETPGPPGAIDRTRMRSLLADRVADRITFDRRIESINQVGPADLIVVADGVGSALRQELIPGHDPQPLGSSAIFGRTAITEANRGWLAPVILRSRFCGVVDTDTTLALCAYDAPHAPAPYVMWVLIGPTSELPTARADLLDFARNRTADWDPRATAVLRETTADDCFATPLRAMPEVPPLPTPTGVPVAFLGDAIHAMSPAGGEGANTAFADAALLVRAVRSGGPIDQAVAQYHEQMRAMAGEALRRSANYGPKVAPHA